MKSIKWFILFMIIVLLTGCISKESREFARDKEVQKEIAGIIISKGEEYGLKLEPNTKRMKFPLSPGLPIPDDRKLVVPVKTVGDPEFSFEVELWIRSQNEETRKIGKFDYREIGDIGEFLVKRAFVEKYRSAFDALREFDSAIEFKNIRVEAKTSVHIEDEREKDKLIRDIVADYNAGKFTNPKEYKNLLDKYMLEEEEHRETKQYLPEIKLKLKTPYSPDVDMQKKARDIKEYILQNENLPPAYYHLSSEDDEPIDGEDTDLYFHKLE